MLRDFRSSEEPRGGPSAQSNEAITNCLRQLMLLSQADLGDPSIRSSLRALRDFVDSVLARAVESVEQNFELQESNFKRRSPENRKDFGESGKAQTSNTFEQSAWQSRRRSKLEKDEKRARREQREEILRDLRHRVSEIKSGASSVPVNTIENAVPEDESKKFDFAVRYQRASVWPQGSLDWAHQFLGIEAGMSDAEKRHCYLQMVKACHPDLNKTVPINSIQLVNSAWELIR